MKKLSSDEPLAPATSRDLQLMAERVDDGYQKAIEWLTGLRKHTMEMHLKLIEAAQEREQQEARKRESEQIDRRLGCDG
jgi:hypothetical protein